MNNEHMNEETYESLQQIKEIGKTFYSDMNVFNKEFSKTTEKQQNLECLFSIEDSLKKGLFPTDLENDEIQVLERTYGEQWYLKFGFSKNDLPKDTTPETISIGGEDIKKNKKLRNRYKGRKYSHTK